MADDIDTQVVQPNEDQKPQAGGEEFDAERAKALIAKLRGEEKRAKQLEKELASIRQADEERKLAEMSQLERLQAELTKANDARQRLEADYARQVRNSAIVAAAAKAGMHDPNDAIAIMADVDAEGLTEAMDKLKASKPYLFKSNVPGNFSPTNPAGGAPKETAQARLDRIYGRTSDVNIFDGPGGGLVWNTNITE